MSHTIVCRARVSAFCLDEEPTSAMFFGENLSMNEDGTFDGESLVCDPCYSLICLHSPSGRGLHHEIPEAIERARARLA